MKMKIFNRGKGWYVPCSNYKDENDKAYLNIFFPKNTSPEYIDNGRGFSTKDIDIQEAKFTSYQGKVGMTIFKYELLTEIPEETYQRQIELNDGEKNMFGAENYIEQDDLPFY